MGAMALSNHEHAPWPLRSRISCAFSTARSAIARPLGFVIVNGPGFGTRCACLLAGERHPRHGCPSRMMSHSRPVIRHCRRGRS